MKNYLIVIDMQHDFVSGALGTAEAQAIMPAVIARIQQAKSAGETVLYTLDTHPENYMETQEGRKLPVPHCIRGSEGWLPEGELKALLSDAVCFEKPTFGSMALMQYMAQESAGCLEGKGMHIELIGVCTDICVVSNTLLLKAALPEATICVDARLCAGVTPAAHDAAVSVLKSCLIDVQE